MRLKLIAASLILVSISSLALCQEMQINLLPVQSNHKVYVGLDNELCVCNGGSKDKELVYETDNGKIRKAADKVFITPNTPGRISITVAEISKHGVYGRKRTIQIVADSLPKPEIILHGMTGGKITKAALSHEETLIARMPEIQIDVRFAVESFSMIIIRNNNVIYSTNTTGYRFSEDSKKMFDTLLPADVIIVKEIVARSVKTNKTQILNSVIYEIK